MTTKQKPQLNWPSGRIPFHVRRHDALPEDRERKAQVELDEWGMQPCVGRLTGRRRQYGGYRTYSPRWLEEG